MPAGKRWIVESRECDKPMAKSKGLLNGKDKGIGKCAGRCENCIACIETDVSGERRHVEVRG